jgi:hypothetical protein
MSPIAREISSEGGYATLHEGTAIKPDGSRDITDEVVERYDVRYPVNGCSSAVPVQADADAPLAGCSATHAGDAWVYDCNGIGASSADQSDRLEAGPFLDGMKAGKRVVLGDAGRFERERSVVGGHGAEILSVFAGQVRVAVTAFVALPEGTRIVECVGSPSDRCGRVMDALVRCPWRTSAPGAVIVADVDLRLAGRSPTVPSGCTGRPGTSGGSITCPGPGGGFSAIWAEALDETSATRAVEEFRKQMAQWMPPSIAPERVPCRIAGADTSCERFVATVPNEPGNAAAGTHRFVAMLGWATIAGRPTIAVCTGKGSDPVPPPCASVFELR